MREPTSLTDPDLRSPAERLSPLVEIVGYCVIFNESGLQQNCTRAWQESIVDDIGCYNSLGQTFHNVLARKQVRSEKI